MTLDRLVMFSALTILCGVVAARSGPDGTPAPTAVPGPDPCALLRPAEIEAVQGERAVETKSSRPERSLFAVEQCFFRLPTYSRSISLEVVRRDPSRDGARSPREHWRELFHEGAEGPGEREEEGEEMSGPIPVPGVGDEAFWTGDGLIGALYVLKGDVYVRLSLGGPQDARARIEKSKTLAAKALRRL